MYGHHSEGGVMTVEGERLIVDTSDGRHGEYSFDFDRGAYRKLPLPTFGGLPVIACPEMPEGYFFPIQFTDEQKRLWETKGICPMCNKQHGNVGDIAAELAAAISRSRRDTK